MDGDENTTGDFASALLPPFAAVVGVTVILMALFVWVGPDDPETGVLSASTLTPTSPPAASPTPAPATSSPPASSPPASSPAPTTSTPEPSPTVARGEVVVLNQSGGTGLAARVAQLVRDKGWDVDNIGNFRGTVSTTTVYYPPGQEDKAQALADDLPGDPRVMERFSNLSTTRLTIVLTDDYGE